jgi:hypothetical protein
MRPTLQDKLAFVKKKYPYAQFPADFGTHPSDGDALDRLASPIPEWAQKAGTSVKEFFGMETPKNDTIISRAGSMQTAGGKGSYSNMQRAALERAGRMIVDHVVPAQGALSRGAQMVQKANTMYNKEIPHVGMSARGAVSAKSMLGDVVEMSGYHYNPSGGYVMLNTAEPDQEIIDDVYKEADARGLPPEMVAKEKQEYLEFSLSPQGAEYTRQQSALNKPLWMNPDGSVTRVRDLEEGPNAVTKVMRYVPKFMENANQT